MAEIRPQPARGLPSRPVDPARANAGSDVRVVGPGRLERGYRERIGALERSVETAALVERGAARLMDRLELELDREREQLARTRQQANRLLVGLGALQRENELLRARVLELEAPATRAPRLAAGAGPVETGRRRPGLWARLRGARKRQG